MLLFSFMYYKNSADFYIHTKMMGYWKKVKLEKKQQEGILEWKDGIYDRNSIVLYKKTYYQAIEEKNAGEPNDFIGGMMYYMFVSPKEIYYRILILQGIITVITMIFINITNISVYSLTIGVLSWHNFYYIFGLYQQIKSLFYGK
jgi:hypothetical protein